MAGLARGNQSAVVGNTRGGSDSTWLHLNLQQSFPGPASWMDGADEAANDPIPCLPKSTVGKLRNQLF